MRARIAAAVAGLMGIASSTASAEDITFEQAIDRAHGSAPDLGIARAKEQVSLAEVGIAGIYPNPTIIVGSSTLTAKFSLGLSIPLVILGQRGATQDAARADYVTTTVESEIVWNEVRASTERAFVDLWRAEQLSKTRTDAALLTARLDEAARGRVDVGSAPELEALRAHAERLRSEADSEEAKGLIAAAQSALGRWIGVPGGAGLRTAGEPAVPVPAPALPALLAQVGDSAVVRRENADAAAAQARADRERALVRPLMFLDVGLDAYDPGLPGTNYRAQLAIEVPLFNFRGPLIDREERLAVVAKERAGAEQLRLQAEITTAYRTYEAAAAHLGALEGGVVPASEAAANAAEDSYAVGRAQIFAVLDAERARIDARVSVIEARAQRAYAWIEVERTVGAR